MNLARVIAAPSAVALCLSLSCSDPPSPPAQAALTFFVGGKCSATHAQLSVPSDSRTYDELGCNLTTGCKPDDFVVVDRDQGTRITCTVSPRDNGQFQVILSLATDSPKSVSFNVNGSVGPTGGTLAISEGDQLGGGVSLSDPACTADIVPNFGEVKAGAIWAHFKCNQLTDERNPSGNACTAEGWFLFENCSS